MRCCVASRVLPQVPGCFSRGPFLPSHDSVSERTFSSTSLINFLRLLSSQFFVYFLPGLTFLLPLHVSRSKLLTLFFLCILNATTQNLCNNKQCVPARHLEYNKTYLFFLCHTFFRTTILRISIFFPFCIASLHR